jgi:CheY-like chemotaxis protein
MSEELVSLRLIVVSGSREIQDLFRQSASAASVPIDIVEAGGASAASRCFADGADLVFIDGELSSEDSAQVVAAAQAARNPPFTVLLAKVETANHPFKTDALATKPSRLDEARRLVDGAVRVRLRSRVLVVDDSSTMRSIVRKILTATRFPLDVTEADDGIAALALARENEFDIIFLDYNMPGLSGLETLSEFKRERRRVSVVMITSTKDEALEERARALGAAFLKKPFFPTDIEAVLCDFYGLRALNQRRA